MLTKGIGEVGRMKQILCFGDSNTYGLIPGTKERFDWGIRWTGKIAKKLEGTDYRIVEEGLCGRTTIFDDPLRSGRRGTELLPILLESHAPLEIVILMLGTNDCKALYDANAEVIGLGIEKLLDQIQKSQPSLKVLLISPIHLGERVWEEGYDPEFNEVSVETSKNFARVYERIAEKRRIAFVDAARYAKVSERDREHLDEEGHARLAEAVWVTLEKML